MDEAVAARDAVDAQLAGHRSSWATTERELQAAERAVDDAAARIAQLTSEVDQATASLEVLDAQRRTTTDLLGDVTSQADELDSFAAEVDDTVTALINGGVPPEQRAVMSQRLAALATAASSCTVGAPALESVGATLSWWAQGLVDDTAPIDPIAEELLARLVEHEDRWERHGSGDVMGDPTVVATRSALEQARTALVELDSRGVAGAAGNRAKQAIAAAHRRREELEAKGSRADPAELHAAIEAEAEALRHVGFDSMLDYRVTLSTGGSGAHEKARRATVQARIEELESELEQALRDTTALHHTMRSSLDGVREEIDTWLGDTEAADRVAALRGRLAEPADVATARHQLAQDLRTLRGDATARADELAALDSERAQVDDRRSALIAEAERAGDDRHRAETALADARDRLAALGVTLQQLGERSEQAADDVASITAEHDALAGRRYLAEDVRELTAALLAAVSERCSSDDATGVVIDDPLEDLDDAEASAVLAALCDHTWPLPVVFVSSRKKLLTDLRRRSNEMVAPVDGRRGATGRRWFRRTDELGSVS